jgi:3-isopropylmalate dehydratase
MEYHGHGHSLLDFHISFADIFKNNCFNNGMLPLVLPREQVELLLEDTKNSSEQVTVDLVNQKVIRPNGDEIPFDIDPFSKHCLVNGLDKIGLTLAKEHLIVAFEKTRTEQCPWLDGASLTVPASIPMYPSAEFWEQDVNKKQVA